MKQKFNWKVVLVEALMIVLSVLLALFINEWKSNSNELKNTNTVMENISAEIKSNQTLVENFIPYHKTVLEKIQVAALKDSLLTTFLKNGYFEISSIAPRGIKQGDFQNIAWLIAKEERISNRISFEESQLIFSAYEQQARVLKTMERIIKFLGSREIHREELIEESIIVLALEWNEMITQEEELVLRYSQALKKLKES